jgi:Flp pilus assembly secretin CpaC
MTALCKESRVARGALYRLAMAIFLAAAAVAAAPARADQTIIVHLDEARVLKLPDRATTVVIGNPLIADLSVQPGGLAVVTGKSNGATNVIVMDKVGAVLTEHTVEVRGPNDVVLVYRGVTRETYSCTPDCSARLNVGDDVPYFTAVMGEITSRNTQSMAAGSAGSH